MPLQHVGRGAYVRAGRRALGPDDHVIVKHRASAFFETPLYGELRTKGVQVLIIADTTTSFCEDSTVRETYARDFDLVVPVECEAGTDAAAYNAVLRSGGALARRKPCALGRDRLGRW